MTITRLTELTLSFFAQLTGVKQADFFIDVLPKNEVKGLEFYHHENYKNKNYLDDCFWIGRLHIVFSRANSGIARN